MTEDKEHSDSPKGLPVEELVTKGSSVDPEKAPEGFKTTVDENGKTRIVGGKGSGRGGYRPGAGRPAKSGKKKIKIREDKSVDKLEILGHDPLEYTVRQIREVEKEIVEMKKQPRYSTQALAVLYQTRERLNNNLMRYGYRPVSLNPEEKSDDNAKGLSIDLTDKNWTNPDEHSTTQSVLPKEDSSGESEAQDRSKSA